MGTVGVLFFANVAATVQEMRKKGLSDTIIAGIVCDIRAAAIAEERLRAECVVKDNPPAFPSWREIRDTLNDLIEWPAST